MQGEVGGIGLEGEGMGGRSKGPAWDGAGETEKPTSDTSSLTGSLGQALGCRPGDQIQGTGTPVSAKTLPRPFPSLA